MRNRQYISVSGIRQPHDIEALESASGMRGQSQEPQLLVGVQATEKTQFNKVANSRGPNWHPVGDDIWQSFRVTGVPRIARRIIHYSYGSAPAAVPTSELLGRIPDDCRVDGWQFNNLDWHTIDYSPDVEIVRRHVGGEFIIAQLCKRVLEQANPIELAKRLAECGVSHALLDTSGGVGVPFDPDLYRKYIETLYGYAPELGVAIAGGLGAGDGLNPFTTLFAEYPDLSCDAEGKLRDYENSGDGYLGRSTFSTAKASHYVVEAAGAMHEVDEAFESWWQDSMMDLLNPKVQCILRTFHRNNWGKISNAPGSTHNHQAWPGGYLEHIRQVNHFAARIYALWEELGIFASLPVEERFTLEEVLTVTSLHDIEKPFKMIPGQDGQLVKNPDLLTKPQRDEYKREFLREHGIELNPNQQNAMKYVEGIGNDYSPGNRVMLPMATLAHTADLMSARASYNLGNPSAD